MNAKRGQQRQHRISLSRAFTLVELLIVITVIAILALVAVIGYGNWHTTILQKQVQSDLKQAAAAMQDAKNFGTGYPSTVPSSYTPSAGTVLTGGGSADGTTFCINGTTSSNSSIKYYIQDGGGAPLAGTCPATAGQNTPTGVPTWAGTPVVIPATPPYTLTADWNAPTGLPTGATVTGYLLQCSSDLGFQLNILTASVNDGSTAATISSGLSSSTTYFCRVAAFVNGNQGAWSSTVSGSTGS